MDWPQITFIILLTINCTFAAALHGKPKGDWNFGGALINAGLMVWLLYAGGFWK